MAEDRTTALFFELFSGLPRQGPGDADSTLRALALVPGVGPRTRVLDVGCGTGLHTRVLAQGSPARIVAVDNHPPFVEELNRHAQALGLADRLEARVGDMRQLDFAPGSFDLVWSEGAIYVMGFEAGLRGWRPLLAPGGHLCRDRGVLDAPRPAARSVRPSGRRSTPRSATSPTDWPRSRPAGTTRSATSPYRRPPGGTTTTARWRRTSPPSARFTTGKRTRRDSATRSSARSTSGAATRTATATSSSSCGPATASVWPPSPLTLRPRHHDAGHLAHSTRAHAGDPVVRERLADQGRAPPGLSEGTNGVCPTGRPAPRSPGPRGSFRRPSPRTARGLLFRSGP